MTGGTPMTDAKREILARVRAALGDRTPTPAPAQPGPAQPGPDAPGPDAPAGAGVPSGSRGYRRGLDEGTDVVTLFAERVADYRATVVRVPAADLPAAIAEAAAGRRLAVPGGIPDDWIAGLDTVADDPPLDNQQLDGIGGVLTGASVGIALTGTIVLDAGPDQGRRALSLLPDFHLCVIRADQIVGGVPEAIARLDPARPQTWISGPSATSDIELNRVEGVHGPRTLHVLISE
jgi:L-lactate dehydrogenase complex protein LldG